MSEWEECKLGEVAEIQTGPFGSQLHQRDYKVVGTPIITVEHLGENRVLHQNLPLVGDADKERLKRYIIYEGDIVFSRVGSVDRRAYVSKRENGWMFSGRLLRVRPDRKLVSPMYLSYYFGQEDFKEHIRRIAVGATMPSINTSILSGVNILLPPLPEQRAIASVLSSLDDKIDLLHRQNKTLEAMAETLFRQWFVEEADEGWEEVDLDYVTQRITDGAHKSPPTVDVGLPMASVKDMHQWGIHHDSCRKISETDYVELVRNDCRPLKDDIIIAKDGSYLKHVFVAPNDLDLVILSSIAILRPNGKYNPLLLSIYLKMNSTHEALENIVTGAVIPRIVLKDFRKFKLTLPPMKLQIKALKTLEPIYMKCWENVNQISTLEKLRDTLLPKLMSGEVRVKLEQQEADI